MTWLAATRQRWKLAVFVVAMLCAIGTFMAATAPSLQPFVMECAVVGGALFVFSFLWLALAIRCPACGGKVGWFAVRRRPLGNWLTELITWPKCPLCAR